MKQLSVFGNVAIALGILAGCNQAKPEAEIPSSQTEQTNRLTAGGSPSDTNTVPNSPSASQPNSNDDPLRSDVGINAPDIRDMQEQASTPELPPALAQRTFAQIEPVESDDPNELSQFLQRIDGAISDLVVAGSNNIVEKGFFIQEGLRLGQMKLEAGNRLANLPSATDAQRKNGVLTQLVALSHMSGLGDVKSAQQLESLARSLAASNDPDLAHEGRIVLLGFELQALQNGIEDDPNGLLTQIEGLFQRAEDRNFPEFMSLQQAYSVLNQMGFKEGAQRVKQILITEYQAVEDAQLRNEAWLFSVANSQALLNYNQAQQSLLQNPEVDSQDLLVAARGLYDAFPGAQTLEQMSKSVANMEYSGQVAASSQLAEYIATQLSSHADSPAKRVASQLLSDHQARIGLVGKPLSLEGLVDFDGRPIDWTALDGKVVLVDFWATWCMPCLQEIPNIRAVHERLAAEGFEVVAVNMDDSPETASDFIRNQRFPWQNYHFSDAAGFRSQFAQQNGLNMIPFILLRDREGVVSAIHVRGVNLEPTVREALGLPTSLIQD